MNNFNVEALRNGECNHGVSASAQKEAIQSPNSLDDMSREALIDLVRELRRESARNRHLAKEAGEYLEKMQQHIIACQTQVEAIRAGLVDIDAWIFIDLDGITINADGKLEGSAEAIERLRKAKPFLFKGEKQ